MIVGAKSIHGLRDAYVKALATYLASPGEGSLAEAYLLGRRALAEAVGLIDWAAFHEEACGILEVSAAGREAIGHAWTFYRESLSPFEMTQRGYVETNTWLERLNRELRSEIEQKEQLAKQLHEANQELEAFSYSVAHDLRAPLRHIGSFSQLVVDEHSAGLHPAARDLLRRVRNGVRRMDELIDGLLALSRAARAEMVRVPVNLTTHVRSIVARLRQAEPDRDIVVEVAESMNVRGDRLLLEVVLENLLGNAWKFTRKKEGAHIEVGVDATKTPPVYFVRDDGAGFDMAYADKLFGVFQRLHGQDAFPGTGIGLATVQRIVRRHGGRIWAEGQVDRGATFYFTLADAG